MIAGQPRLLLAADFSRTTHTYGPPKIGRKGKVKKMVVVPPPPANSVRPVAFFDTECYPNFWLLKLRPLDGPVYSFRLESGQSFARSQIERMALLFVAYCVVSFNGRGYDVPMITAAMLGYNPQQLKWLNDRIIVEGVKPWELGLPEWEPADHIDVMETAPGAGSQKQYAGRIHYKTMRDLPYDPSTVLQPEQMQNVEEYCENDLGQLQALYEALRPQIKQREALGKRFGMDLRSKSDAQVAEAVLRRRCEQATGFRIYRPEINWNLQFRYKTPNFISFQMPQLQRALQLVQEAIFTLGSSGAVELPPQLKGLEITIGGSTYSLGNGGLHSTEQRAVHRSDEQVLLRDSDVEAYYPSMILGADEYPPAMGRAFLEEYRQIVADRVACKGKVKALKEAGDTGSPDYVEAKVGDDGGKIMINGTFGKTGSHYSVMFAPEMMIQTTVGGQLRLLMLIEWFELYGIPVVSANTDGIVSKCPRHLIQTADYLISEWEKRTGLKMETVEYKAIYSRDVNNYFAVKSDDDVKRKGEYSKAGLVEKKNPDAEICSDAVAEFLAKGTPILYTISACRDIRKFVTIQKVNGGAVKMWGEGPRKGTRVVDMTGTLAASGWIKEGRKWRRGDVLADASTAYGMCFAPQRPEYLGKVVRWYYGTRSPGPILYATNGNTVGLSYGATPCMTLPDEFPDDIDYDWYVEKAENILTDIGFNVLT